ncbi:MAG: molybdate ABC transporter substrate-binding protein [Azospirillaceae bacterium]|nr:molybdate ABC transporter substrate-binding protein [Azospirillaceae bacterium]
MTLKKTMLAALALLTATPALANDLQPSLTVYSAGSAGGVLKAMLKRYQAETGQEVDLETGPAGVMLARIENGEKVDVFISANMGHPQTLASEGKAEPTVVFARNNLCVAALPAVGLTADNLLVRLLDPKVRIGTSTPKADPGGDYAYAFFDKADAVQPGATAVLRAKARQVAGGAGPKPKADATAAEKLAQYGVDTMIGYCSSGSTTPDTSVTKVEIPGKLAIRADYGMAVMTTSHNAGRQAAADRLAQFLLSPAAQAMLADYGFQTALAPKG